MAYLQVGRHRVLVDPDYLPWLSQIPWTTQRSKNTYYAFTKALGRPYVKMHTLILATGRRERVDHINRNGLDNRRANLRRATNAQNMANSVRHRDNRSGFKGVFLMGGHRQSRPWTAQICVMGQRRHLGYFASPEEAARAYDAAAGKAWGERARLNFPAGRKPQH